MLALSSLLAVALIVGILGVAYWRGWPMTLALIITMVLVYLSSFLEGGVPGLANIIFSPLLPDLAWQPAYVAPQAWMHWPTLLGTMFLHANGVHLLANILVFALMGLGLEERLGRERYLLVFFAGGAIGTLVHSMFSFALGEAHIPVVGASGAVFAIMGAYATLYPRDKVFLLILIIIPNVPVYIATVVYTALELLAIQGFGTQGEVARMAHVGGLFGGFIVAVLLMKYGRLHRDEASAPAHVALDLAALENQLTTREQRGMLARLKENQDEPELAHAWLERLARTLTCPACREARLHAKTSGLRCACGHVMDLRKR